MPDRSGLGRRFSISKITYVDQKGNGAMGLTCVFQHLSKWFRKHPRSTKAQQMHMSGLLNCCAVIICLWALMGCDRKKPARPPPPIEVTAAKVLVRDQTVFDENIGQTRGSREVEVRARVDGILEAIHFKEGYLVDRGDLLYTVDPKPYQAAVEEAKGQLARAEAAWANSRQELERFGPLIEKNAISRQQYDEAVSAEKANRAAVESAKAALQSAQLELGYTRITAPTAGLIGKSEVQPGNLVNRNPPTLLTAISTIDPIDVRYSVSEKAYLNWARDKPTPEEVRRASSNVFELILGNNVRYPYKGSLVFIDRNVDPKTGTLLVEVEFPNPDELLRPGQSVRVRFPIAKLTNAVLVPQRSVQELQATYSVFVVTPDNKADSRRVEPGARIGNLWVITSGLKPGDVVVVEGIQKLQPGLPVRPKMVEIQASDVTGATNSQSGGAPLGPEGGSARSNSGP